MKSLSGSAFLFIIILFLAFGVGTFSYAQSPAYPRGQDDSLTHAPSSIPYLLKQQGRALAAVSNPQKTLIILNDKTLLSQQDFFNLDPAKIVSVKEIFNCCDSSIYIKHVILLETEKEE